MHLSKKETFPSILMLLSIVVAYGAVFWLPWVFVLAVVCYLLFLFYLIYKGASVKLILFGSLFVFGLGFSLIWRVCLWVLTLLGMLFMLT